jgi:citrate synthase
LRLLAAVAVQRETGAATVAGTLAQAWRPDSEALLNAALVLCADHELNASSFAARIVAAAAATPYAAVMAGLAALSGFKHGGQTARAAAFLRDVGDPVRVPMVIAERLQRGEGLPGFGHRLYPKRDPRAATLLDLLGEAYPDAPGLALAHAVVRTAATVQAGAPSIDFALAVLEQTLALPAGAGLTLFAIGRTVGWIGHVLEQYQGQRLIRPRARYTGVPPGLDSPQQRQATSTARHKYVPS